VFDRPAGWFGGARVSAPVTESYRILAPKKLTALLD
jgi:hypothetical protein